MTPAALAQSSQSVPSDFLRDSVDINGRGIISSWRDTISRAILIVERPYPVWLSTSISYSGSKTHETIGYDSLLHSLYVQRDLKGHPEHLEVQLMDSTYVMFEFYLGDDRINAVGRSKKYYRQYTELKCVDQEDSTYIARERQCPLVYSEVLRSWEEPCHAPLGEWLHYWPNGVLESRGEYHPKEFEGVKDEITQYKGETYFIQTRKDTRVKVGRWEYYDEQGQLIHTVSYDPIWLNSPYRK